MTQMLAPPVKRIHRAVQPQKRRFEGLIVLMFVAALFSPLNDQPSTINFGGSQIQHTWGPDLTGTMDGAAGIGGLIEVDEQLFNKPMTKSLVISDGKGNITGLVDATTGTIVAKYDYGIFGEVIRVSGSRADACPLRWQSKYYYRDLKLYDFSQRMYNPGTRAWTTPDPLRRVDGTLYNYCLNQPLDYCDPTGGKPQLISQVGSSDIDNTARVIDGVPQVHYSDYANWWSPLTDGATTDWWQSPTNDELDRLFQPTAGGYRLAGVYERSAVWDQQMGTAFPTAMQNAQTSFGAFAKVSGGGIAAASGVGALYIGGTGGLILAGHEFYAAGSNWFGAANGTDYPTTPEGLLAQSGGASDGVVTGVDLAALPFLGSLRFVRPRVPVAPYQVGPYNVLKEGSVVGDNLDIHHVGQAYAMGELIPGYARLTGPSIVLPAVEHELIPTLRGSIGLTPRQLLSNDIRNLRNFTSAPNSSLLELIKQNKLMYPKAFSK